MTIPQDQAAYFAQTFERMLINVSRAVVGKEHVVRLALTCLLSEGHLLLEDNPGTGKTMLARAIANSVQGSQSRIQFTPDLLPSDVTGVETFDLQKRQFGRARCSGRSCSPTRSTARRRRRSRPCWR